MIGSALASGSGGVNLSCHGICNSRPHLGQSTPDPASVWRAFILRPQLQTKRTKPGLGTAGGVLLGATVFPAKALGAAVLVVPALAAVLGAAIAVTLTPGILMIVPQPGHLIRRPANSSLACSFLPHSQLNGMAMIAPAFGAHGVERIVNPI
jgi:hypothetical protein